MLHLSDCFLYNERSCKGNFGDDSKMMGGMGSVPYRCQKCNKVFESGRYLDYLNHLRSHQ